MKLEPNGNHWFVWHFLVHMIINGQDDKCAAMWENMIHHLTSCISNHNVVAKMIGIHTHMVDGYIFNYAIHHS
jgi:flagellar biosynthesis regulator FlbT